MYNTDMANCVIGGIRTIFRVMYMYFILLLLYACVKFFFVIRNKVCFTNEILSPRLVQKKKYEYINWPRTKVVKKNCQTGGYYQ